MSAEGVHHCKLRCPLSVGCGVKTTHSQPVHKPSVQDLHKSNSPCRTPLKHCLPQNKRKKEKEKKQTLLLYNLENLFPKRSFPDEQRLQQGSRWWINVVEVAGIFEGFIEFNVSFFPISAAIFSGGNNTSADV